MQYILPFTCILISLYILLDFAQRFEKFLFAQKIKKEHRKISQQVGSSTQPQSTMFRKYPPPITDENPIEETNIPPAPVKLEKAYDEY